jgi:hypothetical protein
MHEAPPDELSPKFTYVDQEHGIKRKIPPRGTEQLKTLNDDGAASIMP